MNNFGVFLHELRKEKGMTQAALAERLGVTNKAVSKWETGEAMPETAQLLPISRVFGVTVDELLDGKRADDLPEKEASTADKDEMRQHMFTRGKDDKRSVNEIVCGAVCATLFFTGTATYLTLGALFGLWSAPYWLLIPVSALACGIAGILFDLCNAKKRNQRKARGENPYTGAACGLLIISCIIVYLCLGAFLNLWHPTWIILVVGALACGVLGAFGNIFVDKKKDK